MRSFPGCDGLVVQACREVEAWRPLEQALLDAGVPLALPHRTAWAQYAPAAGSWFLVARDAAGRPQGGLAAQLHPSRALPGHFVLRAERFVADAAPATATALLQALAHLAQQQPRVLRLQVELFSADDEARRRTAESARAQGYQPASEPRSYDRTLWMDLRPAEDALFAGLHATARRHVRAVEKRPVAVRPVADPALGPRLDALLAETLARTGGHFQPRDWAGPIALSARHPALSRLVGLFRTDHDGPDALLAFAWGCGHGRYAHYATAASTRATELKMPLLYALAWDLILWAKRSGCEHFDFGGIAPGSHGSGEALGGISDFKRYFCTHEVTVGEEWALEPSRWKAAAARATRTASGWLRALPALRSTASGAAAPG